MGLDIDFMVEKKVEDNWVCIKTPPVFKSAYLASEYWWEGYIWEIERNYVLFSILSGESFRLVGNPKLIEVNQYKPITDISLSDKALKYSKGCEDENNCYCLTLSELIDFDWGQKLLMEDYIHYANDIYDGNYGRMKTWSNNLYLLEICKEFYFGILKEMQRICAFEADSDKDRVRCVFWIS